MRAVLVRLATVTLVVVVATTTLVRTAESSGRVLLVGYGQNTNGQAGGGEQREASEAAFSISGSVHGLVPGLSKVMTLTVHNPQAFAIVVDSISTTVRNASRRCLASSLEVARYKGMLAVRRHRSATIRVRVRLRLDAPDSCQGVTFPLDYHGLGQRS